MTKFLFCALAVLAIACSSKPKNKGTATTGGAASGSSGSTGSVAALPATLTVVVQGSGTITSFPLGIDCGATCTQALHVGDSLALYASADLAAVFSSWSQSDCSGTQCVVTLTGDTTVTATFAAAAANTALTVTLAGAGRGTVTSADGSIHCAAGSGVCNSNQTGVSFTLTATPEAGYFFAGWRGACAGTAPCVVTANAVAVQAGFSGIAFVQSPNENIWSMDLAGKAATQLTTYRNVALADRAGVSSNGMVIAIPALADPSGGDAVVANKNLWVLDLWSRTFSPVTDYAATANVSNVYPPAVSNDGKQVAFASNRANTISETVNAFQTVWVVNTDASGAIPLAGSATLSVSGPFQFSPDGTHVAFFAMNGGSQDVYVCKTDGSGAVVNASNLVSGDVRNLAWSPDGQSIFAMGRDAWIVDPTGAVPAVRHTTYSVAHFSATQPMWSADGSKVFYLTNRTSTTDETAVNSAENIWSMGVSAADIGT